MQSYNYDTMQYYIIKFSKEGFDKNYNLVKLYCYLLKVILILNYYYNVFYSLRELYIKGFSLFFVYLNSN